MQLVENRFKRAIASGRQQIGLWCSLPFAFTAEIVAPAGYDWLLFDMEHSPSSVPTIMSQLQAVNGYDVSACVRAAENNTVRIKQLLDIGAQTLVLPYVESVEEAERAALSMRYPPDGIRGVSGLTRATRFGRTPEYFRRASEELCLVVQIETRTALDHLEDIAKVDGVDGVFIGPADLAASLGHPGDQSHPEVKAAVEDAIKRIRACGKPAGVLTTDTAFAQRCIDLGTVFTAVAIDIGILARGAEAIAQQFRKT